MAKKFAPPCNISLVIRAAHFAAVKYRHQRRKDSAASPYINHPIMLAEILSVEGGVSDPVVLAASLLHDSLENTETTSEELRGKFGATVAAIVEEVTDVKWLDKVARTKIQIARARRWSKDAILVKLANKIGNLRDILANPPAKCRSITSASILTGQRKSLFKCVARA